MRDLTVTLIQADLAWEAPERNRAIFENVVRDSVTSTDLIVLPEMFTTGFSMNAQSLAEVMGGPTEKWMRALAVEFDCAVTGSLPIQDGEQVVNRMLFVTPESCAHYDKRHLFRMAGEANAYASGVERVVLPWRDWRIKLEVCYDLRFPVFARNRQDYDLLLNVANWPERRALHWRTLLQARAIENQACVLGVNRIGKDGVDVQYSGDSLAIDARGAVLLDLESRAACETVTLSAGELLEYRERYPFYREADDFTLA